MSIDKTLKRGSRLVRSRNVLKRDERIEQMKADDRWQEGMCPLGIPKTRVQKVVIGKKKKKEKKEEEATASAPAAAPAKKK